ncbi:MAG: anthranilate synthase component I, partial [Corynebacterium sp.]|nr:anthranilate synthase component I [Corynebacterium sp.]
MTEYDTADPYTITDRATFRRLAARNRVVPVARKVLADGESAMSAYTKLAGGRPGTFLLESAAPGQSWSRHSFIGTGARCALTAKGRALPWNGPPPA